MRTTVTFETGLWRRLREEAAKQGKTITACLNEFLRLGFEASRAQQGALKGRGLPAFSLGKPLVDPADRHALNEILRRP